jgi:putative endonuclease
MKTTARQHLALGAYGERIAARYLEERGMKVLERNWRCRFGELDLVLRDGDEVVACEVKARRGTGFGHPLEAVGTTKLERIRQLALRWAEERGATVRALRVDVVGIVVPRSGRPEIEHLRGVG